MSAETSDSVWEIVLEVLDRKVFGLQATSHASVASFEFGRKRLSGEIDAEAGPDDDVPDLDSLEVLLKHDAGWTQDFGAADSSVASAWWSSKAELTCAQLAVPITIEKVLNLSRKVLVSRADV